MNDIEFTRIMMDVAAACGKPLAADASHVYYRLLGNLPVEALRYAADQAILENTFPVFPQIGTFHKHAQEFLKAKQRAAWIAEENKESVQRLSVTDEGAKKCFSELSRRWKQIAVDNDLGPGRQ